MSGSESGIYVEPDSGSDRCLKSQSGSTATTERTQQAVFFFTMCDPLGELAKATPHSVLNLLSVSLLRPWLLTFLFEMQGD